MNDTSFTPTDNPMMTGILGRCPQCQQGHLFDGYLKLAPRCEVCGLDYSFADPADGPAFFAMTIAAVPALAFGVWFQTSFGLPLWVHVVTTVPLTILCCMALLRPLKGWLVCSQYFHKAEEGTIDREWHADAARKSQKTDGAT
ncbi:DUF983 domain-containing protein [Aquamicrobium sp. LC103]|uniref:DUF983 domain-containing protein n=1 Tax=Aquamicrobium sp. LC103 TaxID=1120658 RepID=UPI00063E9F0D|nr:DUF983 domain-containing protein [Aquamicrobium sp. LC103]TKT76357.1 DUF983 domain-containing protein [Aquamicrobium sp. LC103]